MASSATSRYSSANAQGDSMADSAADTPIDELRLKESEQILEVKYLDEKYHNGDRKISAKSEKKENLEVEEASYSQYVLISIQVFDDDHKPTKRRLRINSPHICNALEEKVQFYPAFSERYNPPVEIESPFALLFHHQHELLQCKEEALADAKRHFEVLFEYLNKEAGSTAAEMIGKNLITFDLLWILFKPGDYVYRIEDGHRRVFWLQQAAEAYDPREKQRYLKLECLYTASNATTVGKATEVVKIYENEFPGPGPREISALSTVPLRFLRDVDTEIKQEMRERAKLYYELERSDRRPLTRHYRGLCQTFTPKQFLENWEPQTMTGRVQIDTKAFMEENPSEKIHVVDWDSPEDKWKESSKPKPDEPDILCPPYVYGYSLGMRKWCRFFLKSLSAIKWDQEMWKKHLILPEPHKKLVECLVSKHSFPSETEIHDEDALKGKGLVIVLHGSPGTGKTLTAVSIAEHIKKPLLLYPAGELGLNLNSIQSSIKTVVRCASRWEAILLVDEADVFLESRQSGGQPNLERNALVAVFLRQLEYSQGVIFLTSNRAQMFDAAVKSRVHLTMHYPPPNLDIRRQLWESHLEKIPDDRRQLETATVLRLVTRYMLNGREIANMINSAMALAKDDGEHAKLRQVHLENALEVWETSSLRTAQRTGERVHKVMVDLIIPVLGVLVLLGLSVVVFFHGYQVMLGGSRDILILYR